MNKEKYLTPETEFIEFETEDIITTSGGYDNNYYQDEDELPYIPHN